MVWVQVIVLLVLWKKPAHSFSGYWKDTVSAKDYTNESRIQEKRRALAATESDEEEAVSQTLDSVKQPARKRARTKDAKKLFMTSDDDETRDDAVFDIEDSLEAPPAPSTPAARARASKRRRVVADDDSDDGVTFKGFGKKRRV